MAGPIDMLLQAVALALAVALVAGYWPVRWATSSRWRDCGMSEAARLVLCSRSAHDQNVLARRAQWDQQGWSHSGMVV